MPKEKSSIDATSSSRTTMATLEPRPTGEEPERRTRKGKSSRWCKDFDVVRVLDIRDLEEDQGITRRGFIDLFNSDFRHNHFKHAGENMQNLKSSLRKIGLDVGQDMVPLEDELVDGQMKYCNSLEGSTPRRLGIHQRKCTGHVKDGNAFNARSKDAGISASWTRFRRLENRAVE